MIGRPERKRAETEMATEVEALYPLATGRSGFLAGKASQFGIPEYRRHDYRSYRTTVRKSGSLRAAVGCTV